MDSLEHKTNSLLRRLRRLQKEQCCQHIDQQIKLWLQSTTPTSLSSLFTLATTTTTTTSSPSSSLSAPNTAHALKSPQPDATESSSSHVAEQPQQNQQPQQQIHNQKKESSSSTDAPSSPPATRLEPNQEDMPIIKSEPLPQEEQVEPQVKQELPQKQQLTNIKLEPQQQSQHPQQLQPTHFTPGSTIDHNERTIGCFLSNIKHLESYDSDETESLSSNDSYDELEGFSHEDIPPKKGRFYYPTSTPLQNQLNPQHPKWSDLKEKAIYKWANERSKLASRWTWLQAQVADLEFRIRGQNEAHQYAKAHKIPPLPPVLPESSCSRTVPISRDFRRRRLIKSSQILSDSNKRLVKFAHVPCACSSLPQTVAPCLSCNGRYNYLRQLEGENLPLTERVSLLDPCCHPVLSFPDDVTLSSQLAYILKQETINRKPSKRRPGRKKGSTAANLAAAAAAAVANGGDSNHSGPGRHPDQKNKYYTHRSQGLRNPSQTMLASDKLKRKYRKHSSTTNNYDSATWGNSNSSSYSTGRNKRIRSASSMHDTNSIYITESSNHSRPNHFNSNSNMNSAQGVSRRRRSEQSAYDIDNIVIPLSIAATTRVEVLEYKEIMTPSWRLWENGTCETEHRVDEEAEVEDTSDEAYISRHSKGESEERKRFSLKPPRLAGHQTAASQ